MERLHSSSLILYIRWWMQLDISSPSCNLTKRCCPCGGWEGDECWGEQRWLGSGRVVNTWWGLWFVLCGMDYNGAWLRRGGYEASGGDRLRQGWWRLDSTVVRDQRGGGGDDFKEIPPYLFHYTILQRK